VVVPPSRALAAELLGQADDGRGRGLEFAGEAPRGDAIYSIFEWVPRFRGWRRDPLYRGNGEGFLVHGEKREGYRDLLEKVSSPI
jgi:hypothetical protein